MQPDILNGGRENARACIDFEQRAGQMRQRVYKLALRILGNRTDAEDVTQETLVRAWSSFAQFDPARSFETWVFRIANNLCIDHLRRRRRIQMMPLDPFWGTDQEHEIEGLELADSSNDPAERLLAEEIDERLKDVILALPASYRTCVLLLERDHTYQEIAAMMQCSVGTVRSRLHRARDRVRTALSAQEVAAWRLSSRSVRSADAAKRHWRQHSGSCAVTRLKN